jgi:uncharacterized iron-regulated membrane protein
VSEELASLKGARSARIELVEWAESLPGGASPMPATEAASVFRAGMTRAAQVLELYVVAAKEMETKIRELEAENARLRAAGAAPMPVSPTEAAGPVDAATAARHSRFWGVMGGGF